MWNDVKIAVSGKSGCGNSTLSRLLSEIMGVRLINFTFHTLAEEMNMDFEAFCQMAELDSQWDKFVDQRQVELANSGPCVLGSRLAIWIWKEAEFRVYLDATPEVRASRIQKREGGDFTSVLERTVQRDKRDHERYLRLYNIDNNNFEPADLIIDVTFLSPDQVASKILEEYSRLRGLKNPRV